jgi:hypothetical protein
MRAAALLAVVSAWAVRCAEAAESPTRHPGNGLRLRMGYAAGGDPVITGGEGGRDSLAAGQGWLLAVGASVTPLWTSDGIGFGATLEAGWKRGSARIDGETFTLGRAPLAAALHMLVPTTERLYLVLAAGASKDVAIHADGKVIGESLTLDFTSGMGVIAEIGAVYRLREAASLEIAARYTGITYRGNGNNHIDATNYGLTVGGRLDW